MKLLKIICLLSAVVISQQLMAEETVSEKVENAKNVTVDSVKKGYRAAKDAVCMKGDLECAAQKAKHTAKNTADAAKTKTKKVINKIDND